MRSFKENKVRQTFKEFLRDPTPENKLKFQRAMKKHMDSIIKEMLKDV